MAKIKENTDSLVIHYKRGKRVQMFAGRDITEKQLEQLIDDIKLFIFFRQSCTKERLEQGTNW